MQASDTILYTGITQQRREAEMFTLYWVREDGQGDYNMGTFPSRAAADAAIPAAKAELLDQCGEDFQRVEIERGKFVIAEDDQP